MPTMLSWHHLTVMPSSAWQAWLLPSVLQAAGLDVGALPEPDAFAPAEPDADDEELGFGRGIGLASALC